MATSPKVIRQRRIVAVIGVAVLAALLVFVVTQLTGPKAAEPPKSTADAKATPTATPKPIELPRGGRKILPDFRVVAYFGAPQD